MQIMLKLIEYLNDDSSAIVAIVVFRFYFDVILHIFLLHVFMLNMFIAFLFIIYHSTTKLSI